MVNNKLAASQLQRCLLFAIFAAVGFSSASVSAQSSYYDNTYKIYPSRPVARVARVKTPPKSNLPQPFQVDVGNSDATIRTRTANATSGVPSSPALAKAFSTGQPREPQPSRRLQDVFGENPKQDIFGEDNVQPKPGNPFQKIDAQDKQSPAANPFGELAPRGTDPSQESPFNELPQDPNPQTPPMDTIPVRPNTQVEPKLPPGSEFTPNPQLIDSEPPVPGEEPKPRTNQRPADDESPEADPSTEEDPGEISDDSENSVFDSGEPDDSDIPPVPAPRSSRVYLPARDPTDYVKASGPPIPPSYDPRMMQNNPYANLPGPYGYPAPQPYAGYPPYPNPYAAMAGLLPPMANPNAAFGQCGPGCVPAVGCSNCNTCGTPPGIASSGCGGCNSCSGCNSCGGCNSCKSCSQSAIACSDIGDRIVETAEADPAAEDTYTDVVSDCDNVCSNFASCYVGVFGGWSDLNDFVTRGEFGNGVYFEDSGYLFGATIGQIQGRNLRTELELSYRNISINGLQRNGSIPSQFSGVHGDFGTFAGMLNGYWEFVDIGPEKIKPYLGAGVGFAIARPNLLQSSGAEAVITDDESSFAWQWMAGLNYKASPTLDAFVEYRYFAADSFRLDTQIPEVPGLSDGSGPFDYRSSTVLFGLRARF